jgi:protein involved in polysaccharide export with SLBB domain
MKKFLLTFVLIVFSIPLFAQLSDDQVVDLIRNFHEQGTEQSEIAAELMRKGVTKEQLTRIRDAGQRATVMSSSPSGTDLQSRLRKTSDSPININPQRKADPMVMIDPLLQDSMPFVDEEGLPENRIFGHNIFNNRELTFEPSLNIATPENHLLGPGDEVIVDIWGESEQTFRQEISPEGTIVIPRLGPVQLNGFTVQQAESRLRVSLARVYASMGGGQPSTFVKLSLGRIRSIQVHVMGEVVHPGTYTISSLATLFHVLYVAGGVNGIGSLRGIEVSRNGRTIASVDIYSYLLEGNTEADIAIKEGDVIRVPPYRNLITILGSVKRPMRYEMQEHETLATLIGFAGGFTGDSYQEEVTLVRRSGRLQEVHNVGRADYDRFKMTDGDNVTVAGIIDRFENRLEITGAVFRPGLYAISDSLSTIKQLIRHAEGMRGDAFADRAVLTREKPDYTLEVLPVNIGTILSGQEPDISLRNNDILHIPSISELREEYLVTIQGAVRMPGEYEYADNLSIEDMIVAAGGLLESASTVRADVYRRIKNPGSLSESGKRSESFSFPIRNGLVATDSGEFTLQPFDIVTIRTSPGYEVQKSVTIRGEVLFPGAYTLIEREEHLSDLMRRSGGALSSAYLRGASLIRQKDGNEETRAQSSRKLTEMNGPDSLSTNSLNIASTYSVGIELEKAIAQPGSDYDLALKEGDVLHVPGYVGTVSISGAVLYPNTVAYREGMRIKQYISQAGGYAHRARRGAKIVIHMNGTIARARSLRGAKISPGSEIVIPYRSMRGNRMSAAELLSISTSSISAASLVTSIINSMK